VGEEVVVEGNRGGEAGVRGGVVLLGAELDVPDLLRVDVEARDAVAGGEVADDGEVVEVRGPVAA
jgi:hypothetical protein